MLTAIILAAGEGKRMKSDRTKVLHKVAGTTMISRIVSAMRLSSSVHSIYVVASPNNAQSLEHELQSESLVQIVVQKEALGTAHAVQSVPLNDITTSHVLVMNGDHPLIEASDVGELFQNYEKNNLPHALVGCELEFPEHYGRLKIDTKSRLTKVVEFKDATDDEKKINLINTGIYIFEKEGLEKSISKVQPSSVTNEYYLTQLVELLQPHFGVIVGAPHLAHGVNTPDALMQAQSFVFQKKATQLLNEGVRVWDPLHCYVEPQVKLEADVELQPGVFLSGSTSVGFGTLIESGVRISNSSIGPKSHIKAYSVIEDSELEAENSVGPMAHLRSKTTLQAKVHIGNFVETKKSLFKKEAKCGHHSYIGDATIGERANIGAGTITCNYAADKKKYETKIGNDVFVGTDTKFIAPVEIGNNAITAAGSTITKDVPEKALAVARARQKNIENYHK